MPTPNCLDLLNLLTQKELQHLWATVPLDRQQCEVMVRVSLRPGLAADFLGPVALNDPRLAISPWLWSGAELGTSPRTNALNKALAEAQAANDDGALDDVPLVVEWLVEKLKVSGECWDLFPSDIDFWEDYGTFKLMRETNVGTFIPLGVEFSAVYFFPDSGEDANPRLVVAQTWYDPGDCREWGPVGVYTCSQLIADNTTNALDWLFTSDTLLLSDPTTGEQATLMPGSLNETEEESTEELVPRVGIEPAFGDENDGLLIRSPAPIRLSGQLYYHDGRLYASNTATQVLAIELRLPPK